MKICYVILHYITVRDTIECTESILKSQSGKDFDIVIVDNGSKNDSFKVLSKRFKTNNKIFLLKSDNNLGFAKGNNLGFMYAKKELKSDFIVLLNNDTLINQEDFGDVIIEKYNKYQYYVLGPDIETLDNVHQNPYFRDGLTLGQCKKIKRNQYIHLLLTYIGLDDFFSKRINHDHIIKVEGDVCDISLHGACLIFSKDYIKRFNGLNDNTFLYFEEDILRLYSRYYNFLIMYSSDLYIKHKEDIASQAMYPKRKKKKIFIYKERIKSAKIYEEIYRDFERRKNL